MAIIGVQKEPDPLRRPAIKTAELQRTDSKKTADQKLAETRETMIELARLMDDTRCTNVRVLDLRGVSPVCDYFILATGTSGRQMRSIAHDVAELAESRGMRSFKSVGVGENWIALDLFEAVVHVFSHDGRMYYDLDNLWAEATDVKWKR